MTGHKSIHVHMPRMFKPAEGVVRARIGSTFDGGYIFAASTIKPGMQILTYGLGYNWDFERQFDTLAPCKAIHCYDHTVSGPAMRRKMIKSILKLPFKTRKRLEAMRVARDYDRFFAAGSVRRHFLKAIGIRDSEGEISVNSTFAALPDAGNEVILKCDIEGAEYQILDDLIANAQRCAAMAVEFHDCAEHTGEIIRFVEEMAKTHQIDHLAVNNESKVQPSGVPDYLEFSFSRLDTQAEPEDSQSRLQGVPTSTDSANLDAPNNPKKPAYVISYDDTGTRSWQV